MYGVHYNILLETMMSGLQDVEELTKEFYTSLYFPGGRPVSTHNSGSMFTQFTYFDIGMASIITQYSNTVYIGIAMSGPALQPYTRIFCFYF